MAAAAATYSKHTEYPGVLPVVQSSASRMALSVFDGYTDGQTVTSWDESFGPGVGEKLLLLRLTAVN